MKTFAPFQLISPPENFAQLVVRAAEGFMKRTGVATGRFLVDVFWGEVLRVFRADANVREVETLRGGHLSR